MTFNQLNDHNYVKLGQLYRLHQTDDDPKIPECKAIIGNDFDINYKLPINTTLCQNNPEYLGNTVMHFFAIFDDYNSYENSCLKLLLELGANLFITNDEGHTPLLLAFYKKFKVHLLLQAQFKSQNSTNFKCKNGISHFHVACSVCVTELSEIVEIVDFFLKGGASVNERINDNSPMYPGFMPLHFAAKNAQVQMIELLLSNGANINSKDAKGLTPLHILMKQFKSCNLAQDINDFKCIMTEPCKNTKCLMRVTCNDQYDMCSWLLHLELILQNNSSEIKLSDQDFHRNSFIEFNSKVLLGYTTPLHLASRFNFKTVISLLLQGANLLAKDAEGITPFDICLNRFSLSLILDILKIEKRYQLSKLKFTNGMNLLDVLEAMTTPDKFKQFLEHSVVNVNTFLHFQSPIWAGYSLLHLGILFNCCISELLYRGADVTMINMEGSSPLHFAFSKFSLQHVVKILEAHRQVSINPINRDNLSHLYIACAAGDLEVAQLLLLNGADPNLPILQDFQWIPHHPTYQPIEMKTGSTPLHAAVNSKQCCELINLLLSYNANPHMANADGVTPFQSALNNYRFSKNELLQPILNRMLEIGSEIYSTAAVGVKTLGIALLMLLESESDIITQRLINEFDRKNTYEELGMTKLQVACYIGDLTMVQQELDSVVDINRPINLNLDFYPYVGDTAMHILFRRNPKQTNEIAELLFAHGADPTLKNSENNTPIHVCEDKALQTAISLLGKKFTNVNPINNEGLSHFHLACKTKNLLVVKKFLESGVDINMPVNHFTEDYSGYTPLHFAICYSDEDVIELLLNYGADHKIMNSDGLPPLHKALKSYSFGFSINSRNRIEKIIRLPGVSTQDMSIFGDTVLMTALKSRFANENIVDLLIDIGADVNLSWFTTENLNESSFTFNVVNKFTSKIFQKIIDRVPAITAIDDLGQNAFYHFSSRFDYETSYTSYFKSNIEILLDNGLELDQKDKKGFTALHNAAYLKNSMIGSLLLSLGADVNMKNDDGKTPIDIAFDGGDKDLMSTLALHIQKLKEVGLYLEESNKTHLEYENNEISNIKGQMQNLDICLKEKISSSFSANYFFTEQFIVDYRRIQSSQRQTILKFWKVQDLHKLFPDLFPLINLQLRKARTRTRLLEPAKITFDELIDLLLPDLCFDSICHYLSNDDLMNLIRAKNGKLEFAQLPKNC